MKPVLGLVLLAPLCWAAQASHSFGAFDPVFTPFHPNGSLNLAVIPRYAQLTSEAGTDTIILGGSTGEWPSMTTQERLDTLAAWRSAIDALPPRADPGIPAKVRIMFHVGDVAVERARELARGAARLRADSILIVAPCIMKPASSAMLLKVLGLIAGEAPALPAWYYHYPALYTVDFPIEALLEAAHHSTPGIPSLAGVKYIDSNWTDLKAATALDQHAYQLISTQLLNGMQNLSTAGAIVYTGASPLTNAAYKEFSRGNLTGAAYFNSRVSTLYSVFKAYGDTKSVARVSVSALMPGLDLGPPRLPLEGVPMSILPALRADLKKNGFLI